MIQIEEKIKQSEKSSKLDKIARDGKYILNNILEKMRKNLSTKRKIGERMIWLEDTIRNKMQKLNDIKEKLRGINVDKIRELVETERTLEEAIETVKGDIAVLKYRLEDTENKIKDFEKRLKAGFQKAKKAADINAKLDACEKLITCLEKIRESVFDKIIEIVNRKTNEYFKSIAWMSEEISQIKIHKNFEISIYDKYGMDILGSLSAGYRQILALSYIMALQDISGFTAPLVIDTPLARISGLHRKKIAEIWSNKLNKTQIILLMTDQEYTSEVREIIRESIANEYKLVPETSTIVHIQ